MIKRTFGHRQFSVATQTVKLSDISHDTTLQIRQNDSPWIRGHDIVVSIRNTGKTAFRDNIVVAKRDDKLIVVDGFGRLAAAEELGWEKIEVDILSSRIKDDDLLFIALTANNDQVSQEAFTKSELQEAAYRLYHDLGCKYEKIAEIQGVSVDNVRRRVLRGLQIVEQQSKKDNLTTVQVFTNANTAKTTAVKVLNATLKLSCNTYDELCETMRKKFNIELRMFAGNNDKLVKGLVYELLANEQEQRSTNFLVLFHLKKVGVTTEPAWRMAKRIESLKRLQKIGSFHFADLSSDTACFNGRDVAIFAQNCKGTTKRN